MLEGYVHIYYGNGKGKTCSATGVALRAVAHNLKIAIFRFFKPENTSAEDKILQKFPDIKIFYPKYSSFMFSPDVPEEKIIKDQQRLFEKSRTIVSRKEYDIVILDEVLDLVKLKIISTQDIVQIIKTKPKNVEIILTGHYINKTLKGYAGLVTYFKKIKHYYDKGVKARKGIEF